MKTNPIICVDFDGVNVVVKFGTPTAWLALPPKEARQLAEMILSTMLTKSELDESSARVITLSQITT